MLSLLVAGFFERAERAVVRIQLKLECASSASGVEKTVFPVRGEL